MSSIGYYPGCSLGGTACEYDQSLRAVARRLGVELTEIPEWICCGATSAHAVDHNAAMALAADTLVKAHDAGLREILAPCAMCYQRLASAAVELSNKPQLGAVLGAAMGRQENLAWNSVRVLSILNWLDRMPAEAVAQQARRPLKGLKIACYYGCLMVRPARVSGIEQVESPRNMERIVSAVGATPVRWSMAMECCGASFALSRKEVVLRQTQTIYNAAREAGADAICLACPMCQANLDMRQSEIAADKPLPVLYLTQLMGLAMGMDGKQLGLNKHFVRFNDLPAAGGDASAQNEPQVVS